jgi:hypothetical protein
MTAREARPERTASCDPAGRVYDIRTWTPVFSSTHMDVAEGESRWPSSASSVESCAIFVTALGPPAIPASLASEERTATISLPLICVERHSTRGHARAEG